MEKKSTKFILNSDWFLQRPIDMEHKEYILSSFLSKVEEALGRGEIILTYGFHRKLSKKWKIYCVEKRVFRNR